MHPHLTYAGSLPIRCSYQFRILARDERLNASAFDLILVNSYFSRESLFRVCTDWIRLFAIWVWTRSYL